MQPAPAAADGSDDSDDEPAPPPAPLPAPAPAPPPAPLPAPAAAAAPEYKLESSSGGCVIAAMNQAIGLDIPPKILVDADAAAMGAAESSGISQEDLRLVIGDPNDGGAFSQFHVTEILKLLLKAGLIETYEYRRLKGSPHEIHKAIMNLPPGTSVIVNGTMNRHTAAEIAAKSHPLPPITWAKQSEMGDDADGEFMHTILVRGKKFYCNNIRGHRGRKGKGPGRMLGQAIKHLCIADDGAMRDDAWRYMKAIDRCYTLKVVKKKTSKRRANQYAVWGGAVPHHGPENMRATMHLNVHGRPK
jgi:hypothetical protein